MAERVVKWKCSWCLQEYDSKKEAESCERIDKEIVDPMNKLSARLVVERSNAGLPHI